jgi:uncharacterized protein (DUF305 family)
MTGRLVSLEEVQSMRCSPLAVILVCVLAIACGGRREPGSHVMTAGEEQTAPFDAGFIDAMIEHHQGAVAMAEEALDSAVHPEIYSLAEGIIAGQTIEIDSMRVWRQRWYPGLEATGGMGMSMGAMDIGGSPGVVWDLRFLEAMISHHQGAISMARAALESAEHEEIRDLASAIVTAQQEEITVMTALLSAWSDSAEAP